MSINVTMKTYSHIKNIDNKKSKISFGRAITPNETQKLSEALKLGYSKSGIDFFAMITSIAAVPAKGIKNTGIGTFQGASSFLQKISKLTGINAAQLLPTGEVSKGSSYSPFNTPGFGLYHGYNDLSLLTKGEFGHLLDKGDEVLRDFHIPDGYRTNYENIEIVKNALNKAYDNYVSRIGSGDKDIERLTGEFNKFKEKKEIKYWLDTYAENKDSKNPERYKFKQFLTQKQYERMQKKCEEDNIKLIVDCPIGMDKNLDGQVGARNNNGKNPFFNGCDSLACYDNGRAVRWELPVLHPDHAQSLIYHKALYHGGHGNGARIDAAQYLAYPSINNGRDNKVVIPQIYRDNSAQKPIANSFFRGLKDSGVEDSTCVAEHMPFMPEYDVSDVDKYLAHDNPLGNIPKFTCAQWRDVAPTSPEKWDSYANHDEPNIHHNVKGNWQAVQDTFLWFLGGPARKYQVMFTDILGYSDSYNVKNTTNQNNWRFRIPENWEEEYHSHLQQGMGFNAPEILDRLLNKKGVNDDSTNKLKGILYRFGQILREKSPINTEIKANEALKSQQLQEYLPSIDDIK